MQHLKRYACLVFSIFFMISALLTVSAQTRTYYLSDLGMSVDIPDYISVSTRDNNPQMTKGIYLEAISASPDLDIRVLMQKDEKTEEFFNLSLLSSAALDEYKEALLSNPQYSDCTEGKYGGVLFLDFTTYDKVGDVAVYGKQSVTIVNGMSVVIMSTSDGDALTSEEIELVRSIVSSIKFDKIEKKSGTAGFWKIFIPIMIGLVLIVAGFFAVSYVRGKKRLAAKQRRRLEMERKADYDVLRRAENKARTPQNPDALGGYKTSDAFFEDAFSPAPTKTENVTAPADKPKAKAKKPAKNPVKSTAYFIKNLKRELSKSSKNKKKPQNKPNPKDRKPRDYDVFSD